MAATRKRVVQTPTKLRAVKVVLEHEGRVDTEQPVAIMPLGEGRFFRPPLHDLILEQRSYFATIVSGHRIAPDRIWEGRP